MRPFTLSASKRDALSVDPEKGTPATMKDGKFSQNNTRAYALVTCMDRSWPNLISSPPLGDQSVQSFISSGPNSHHFRRRCGHRSCHCSWFGRSGSKHSHMVQQQQQGHTSGRDYRVRVWRQMYAQKTYLAGYQSQKTDGFPRSRVSGGRDQSGGS